MTNLIQWPRAQYWDKPWNPWLGCKPISPACDNCYARCATEDRFGQSFEPHRTQKVSPPNTGVVFCGNMIDLFGEWADPLDYMRKTWPLTATYLYCTKRVHHMANCLSFVDPDYSPLRFSNHYFGFTAENEEWNYIRWREMVDGWSATYGKPEWLNIWVSCEPLIGPIDLATGGEICLLSWVAVGCESGPKRRTCKIEWVESIVDQCRAANVPVFVKQLDLNGKCERDITKFPKHLQIRQVPWAKKEGV